MVAAGGVGVGAISSVAGVVGSTGSIKGAFKPIFPPPGPSPVSNNAFTNNMATNNGTFPNSTSLTKSGTITAAQNSARLGH